LTQIAAPARAWEGEEDLTPHRMPSTAESRTFVSWIGRHRQVPDAPACEEHHDSARFDLPAKMARTVLCSRLVVTTLPHCSPNPEKLS